MHNKRTLFTLNTQYGTGPRLSNSSWINEQKNFFFNFWCFSIKTEESSFLFCCLDLKKKMWILAFPSIFLFSPCSLSIEIDYFFISLPLWNKEERKCFLLLFESAVKRNYWLYSSVLMYISQWWEGNMVNRNKLFIRPSQTGEQWIMEKTNRENYKEKSWHCQKLYRHWLLFGLM